MIFRFRDRHWHLDSQALQRVLLHHGSFPHRLVCIIDVEIVEPVAEVERVQNLMDDRINEGPSRVLCKPIFASCRLEIGYLR